MKKIFIAIFLTTLLHPTTYENAEDKSTKRWKAFNSSNSIIKNIYDRDKRSRVIFLKSRSIRDGFMLKMERNSKVWCKGNGKYLKWSMQTNSDFVIIVSLQTKNGHRNLVYTSSDWNGQGYFGLGEETTNGKWHTFKRDLNLDLKKHELDNDIIAVDTFFIRGKEIKLDDIKIEGDKVKLSKKGKRRKRAYKPKNCNIYVPKIYNTQEDIQNDTTPPVIKLVGKQRVYLSLGEEYRELGATATDNVDGDIDVEISGDVDINRVGAYTIFYTAKDRAGNTAIDTRIINVKGSGFKTSKPIKPKSTPTPIKKESKKIENLLQFELPDNQEDLEELMAED